MKVLRSILLFCSWYMLKRSLTQRKSFFIASSLQFKADVAKLRKAGNPLDMGNMISEQKASTADEERQQQMSIFHPNRILTLYISCDIYITFTEHHHISREDPGCIWQRCLPCTSLPRPILHRFQCSAFQ